MSAHEPPTLEGRTMQELGRMLREDDRAGMNAGLFEFECGYRVVASRNSIRRAA